MGSKIWSEYRKTSTTCGHKLCSTFNWNFFSKSRISHLQHHVPLSTLTLSIYFLQQTFFGFNMWIVNVSTNYHNKDYDQYRLMPSFTFQFECWQKWNQLQYRLNKWPEVELIFLVGKFTMEWGRGTKEKKMGGGRRRRVSTNKAN